MHSENVRESKAERLTLHALPSILRNLSQLSRSGLVRFSFEEGYAYLELEDGEIKRLLIPEDLFIVYLIERLREANLIKVNIADLLVGSKMNLKEFSLYLVKEKITSNAQVSVLFMKFARELLFSLFERREGSLDFNIRLDLISHIEPSSYVLNVFTTPGQLFLDYWEMREKYEILKKSGEQFFSGPAELGTIFSPMEKTIMHLAQSGAYLQSLIIGVFEAREEVVETMLRLSQSGILLPEDTTIQNEELLSEVIVVDPNILKEEVSQITACDKGSGRSFFEMSLPLIVLALICKFVIEYQSIINLIENSFSS